MLCTICKCQEFLFLHTHVSQNSERTENELSQFDFTLLLCYGGKQVTALYSAHKQHEGYIKSFMLDL